MSNREAKLRYAENYLDTAAEKIKLAQDAVDNLRVQFATDQLMQLELDRMQTQIDIRRRNIRKLKERVAFHAQ